MEHLGHARIHSSRKGIDCSKRVFAGHPWRLAALVLQLLLSETPCLATLLEDLVPTNEFLYVWFPSAGRKFLAVCGETYDGRLWSELAPLSQRIPASGVRTPLARQKPQHLPSKWWSSGSPVLNLDT